MTSKEKNDVLRTLAHLLNKNTDRILHNNIKDLKSLEADNKLITDRLKF